MLYRGMVVVLSLMMETGGMVVLAIGTNLDFGLGEDLAQQQRHHVDRVLELTAHIRLFTSS